MNSRFVLPFILLSAGLFSAFNARADDGFWDATSGGSWASAGNWDSGIIADGEDSFAYFGLSLFADVPASATFTLNGARTIGHLFFTDDNGPDNWALNTGSGGPLTLIATLDTPSITVNRFDQQVTINAVLAGTNGLEKLGPGALVLAAANSISGDALVSEGTLRVNGSFKPASLLVSGGVLEGTGTITGPVSIAPGGILSPGGSTGTLAISNSLTLQPGSTTIIEVNASTLARDLVTGLSAVNYGGTLAVSNLAGTPTLGQSFQIFNAPASSGNFTGLTPQLSGGLRWRFEPGTGLLVVVSTNSQPRFASFALEGKTNLVMRVTNGVPGATNYVLASTNLALARANWQRVATNVFDAGGNFAFTNLLNPALAQRFFQISMVLAP